VTPLALMRAAVKSETNVLVFSQEGDEKIAVRWIPLSSVPFLAQPRLFQINIQQLVYAVEWVSADEWKPYYPNQFLL